MSRQAIKRLLIILLVLLLTSKSLPSDKKIEFWDVQRKGANCFNVTSEEQWFKAAHELGIEWVRLTYDKWKGQRRDFLMGDTNNFTGIIQEDLAKLLGPHLEYGQILLGEIVGEDFTLTGRTLDRLGLEGTCRGDQRSYLRRVLGGVFKQAA